MRTRSLQRYVAVGAAVLTLTGCVDEPTSMEPAAPSSTASSVTTPATVPSTTTTAEDPAAAVLAAYEGFNRAFVESRDPYDPENPELERYATGDLLDRIRTDFEQKLTAGNIGRGDIAVGMVKVSFVSESVASVMACSLDRTYSESQSGEIDVAADSEALLIEARLELFDTRWKVVSEQYPNSERISCSLD